MSTFMANQDTITRKWYVLDAAGKPLGKTAAQAAVLLRGKHKPELAMKLAVRGMMPRNSITSKSLTRLKIYQGNEHKHAAQKPEFWAD